MEESSEFNTIVIKYVLIVEDQAQMIPLIFMSAALVMAKALFIKECRSCLDGSRMLKSSRTELT